MSSRDKEYKEVFFAEAYNSFEELNKLLTDLEKNYQDQQKLNALFRITHTLKGNAMGMGFEGIASISHVMEDVFDAAKADRLDLNSEIFDCLYKAADKLGELIEALKNDAKVGYRGVKTKLSVLLKNSLKDEPEVSSQKSADLEEYAESGGISGPEDPGETPLEQSNGSNEMENGLKSSVTFSDMIQIPTRKLDELLNLVGQMVIERDRLVVTYSEVGKKISEFDPLKRLTEDLQYNVMNIRLVKVDFLFAKFHRIVRDVAALEGKKVNLELKGVDVEIDRSILKAISDSLIHIIRNAVGHGIEPGTERLKLKKEDTGKVVLSARSDKNSVVIEVADDGKGISADAVRKKIVEKGLVSREDAKKLTDDEVINYIFRSGFSNAEQITEISGRGVGMDVVKRATESIGGQVYVRTEEGKGTTIGLRLPTSMALKAALLFGIGEQEYAIPLVYVDAVISLSKKDVNRIGNGLAIEYQNESISLVVLKSLFQVKDLANLEMEDMLTSELEGLGDDDKLEIIIVSMHEQLIAVVVDTLLLRKEIFEKKLEKPMDSIQLLSGTTILGNGKVCPVIDVAALVESVSKTAMSNRV